MGALPAGWHSCMHPEHGVPYYFNTVTQQSQWTFPTAAAAIPLPELLAPEPPKSHSPSAARRVGNDLGGAMDMAATFGLLQPSQQLSAGAAKPKTGPSPLGKTAPAPLLDEL